jgi:pyruvate/2-oxoglutarate dehydrogenase complex dihydrolipoamide acyltransferase (E2) component
MIYQLTVPGPIEDVEETRVLEWHGVAGGAVVPGLLLVELETAKAVVEIRSRLPVFLRRILATEGQWQRIGLPIALLSDALTEELPVEGVSDLPLLEFDYSIS